MGKKKRQRSPSVSQPERQAIAKVSQPLSHEYVEPPEDIEVPSCRYLVMAYNDWTDNNGGQFVDSAAVSVVAYSEDEALNLARALIRKTWYYVREVTEERETADGN